MENTSNQSSTSVRNTPSSEPEAANVQVDTVKPLKVPVVDFPLKDQSSDLSLREERQWENEEKAAQIKHSEDLHQEEIQDRRNDRAERLKYATRIFWLIVGWVVGLGVVICLQGFGSQSKWFSLSDSVLVALVSGTTINVLGIFVVVVNYLFRKNGKDFSTSTEKPSKNLTSKSAKNK